MDGNYKGPAIEGGLTEILRQITKAVDHIHHFNAVHGDLKPKNILISAPRGDSGPMIKLADFGLLHAYSSGKEKQFISAFTKGWMCPTDGLNEEGKRRPSFDIFALGLLFVVTTSNGVHPFGLNLKQAKKRIKNQLPMTLTTEQIDGSISSSAFFELVKKMLDFDASERPTASEILSSSIFHKEEKTFTNSTSSTFSPVSCEDPPAKKMRFSSDEENQDTQFSAGAYLLDLENLNHSPDHSTELVADSLISRTSQVPSSANVVHPEESDDRPASPQPGFSQWEEIVIDSDDSDDTVELVIKPSGNFSAVQVSEEVTLDSDQSQSTDEDDISEDNDFEARSRSSSFDCQFCGKTLKHKRNLMLHLKAHAGAFQCHICGKKTSSKRSLADHMNTHTATQSYLCEICRKSFAWEQSLKVHRKSIHFPPTLECEFCHKMFALPYKLKRHQYGYKGKGIGCPVRRLQLAEAQT